MCLFKVNKRNTTKMCELCSKLKKKIPKQLLFKVNNKDMTTTSFGSF